MKYLFRRTMICALLVASCLTVLLWLRFSFPYGHRSAFLRSMYFALVMYAEDNKGNFPNSENGDYEALQKLYPRYIPTGIELTGISGNVNNVTNFLRNGKTLNQNITSWVYHRGFRENDPTNIAILWESGGGLYPDGKRNYYGGHAVLFINGEIKNIAGSDWAAFQRRQQQLRDTVLLDRSKTNSLPPKK